MKSDILTAMHRSGHHAVAVWLFHQKEKVNDFSIKTVTPWLFSIFIAVSYTHLRAHET